MTSIYVLGHKSFYRVHYIFEQNSFTSKHGHALIHSSGPDLDPDVRTPGNRDSRAGVQGSAPASNESAIRYVYRRDDRGSQVRPHNKCQYYSGCTI